MLALCVPPVSPSMTNIATTALMTIVLPQDNPLHGRIAVHPSKSGALRLRRTHFNEPHRANGHTVFDKADTYFTKLYHACSVVTM